MGRRFKGLQDQPRDSYDAIVIGAGIGGLICANLLAREGLRVLLIEQHYMVGGYCSTFRRKGFTFDAATHFYPLLGNPATITGGLLRELGVETEWVKMDPVDHFHFPDRSSFRVPADFESYLAKLKTDFPSEANNLDRFFALARQLYLLGLLFYFRGQDTDRLDPYRHLTVRQVLDDYFQNEKLKLLLVGDCGHWGAPPSRTSFVFDSMLRLSYFVGNYYPRGGSQAFTDELARRFEQSGGHILMRTLARRIIVNDGKVRGVEIEFGKPDARRLAQVRAEVVVSNGDLLFTLEQLIGPKHIPSDQLAAIRKLRLTAPCFLTYLGLRDVSTEALREIEGYHWDSWDSENVAMNAFKIFVPTLFDRSIAPPDGHIIIVQKLTDVDYDSVSDWRAHKTLVENYIMTKLAQVLPGIAEKIVFKASASALTSHRYTLNHHGAMLGWEMSPDQLGALRPDIAGDIRNLYFVGHWTQPGGGVTPVIVSAMRAARLITQSGVCRESDESAAVFRQQAPGNAGLKTAI